MTDKLDKNNLKTAINYLTLLVEKLADETINKFDFNDLTNQQLHYFRLIVRLQNPSVSELASALKLTNPTVTVLVNKLVAKGYLERVHSDDDRRCTRLYITEKGTKINYALDVANDRMAEEIRSVLSDTEITILIELFKKIAKERNHGKDW